MPFVLITEGSNNSKHFEGVFSSLKRARKYIEVAAQESMHDDFYIMHIRSDQPNSGRIVAEGFIKQTTRKVTWFNDD